jgi:hypothetical protein
MIEYICEIGDGMLPIQELIRCKDCKWAVKCYGDVVMVDKYGEEIHEPLGMNGYCSMAERKEE